MRNDIKRPDSRLSLASSFVRNGSVIADIGTDHAYIPINLILTGKCTRALATDINKGPLARAEANAIRFGVKDKIHFCLADGLKDLPLFEYSVTDIVICGMGGELIASIIDTSDYPKNKDINLILQPMSSIFELRTYLDTAGFKIKDEGITEAQGKLYQCILCSYDGKKRSSSNVQLLLGKKNIAHASKNKYFEPLLKKTVCQTEKIISGMKLGAIETEKEEKLLLELKQIAASKNIDITEVLN